MTKAEILAPVGGREQLVAAVRCGADAVYMGTSGFNARQNAQNFGEAELCEAVEYCKVRGVNVHVTLNTLVFDDELDELKKHIRYVAKSGADAIIIQDTATARLVRDCVPDIAMHASTQMTIHNSLGASAAKELGFSRAVLARELTYDEIRSIGQSVDIELETFVHGALCTCVSGACYLSGMIGGRSGNRGCCAQPCRMDFKNSHGRGYAISLKDMSYVNEINKLVDAGVSSFKIEGRMKRPEYVAAAVTAVRAALDGKKPDMKVLEDVFSRDGFTTGYFYGKRNTSMYGVRTKEDANTSRSVFGELAALYRAERQSVPIGVEASIRRGKPVEVAVNDGEHFATVTGEAPQEAINRPTGYDDVAKAMSKTGGTPFYVEGIRVGFDEGLSVPGGVLNALRREALEDLMAQRRPSAHEYKDAEVVITKYTPEDKPKKRLRFENFDFVAKSGYNDFDKLIIPMDKVLKNPDMAKRYRARLVAEIPPILWESDAVALEAKLIELKALSVEHVTCPNVGVIPAARAVGMTLHGDVWLNVTNSVAMEEYSAMGVEDITVSFETGMNRVKALGGEMPRGIIAWGYLPLMKLRCCPAKGDKGCGGCNGRPFLTDGKGVKFELVCRDKKYTELLNSVPLYVGDKKLGGVDFATLYFTIESDKEISGVLAAFDKGQDLPIPHTNGLYYRELQ
ncbi:MAG: U32 family peptidase [Clostridia bacterium]|nr:U32 family peptidase [Clostridia bacterium]